ncbi:F-box protein [Aspergillus tanneri]|uniref:F-box domain-containing protein n=1 Tax=Aspergillus tanneri TaxID=1220188 RepID=A0A5M9MUB1_9EURO|nr:uncharacterized protein ATNIH1004_003353 [Aspergillus tanneri]KAA8650665.1 hypothetical protein ATNIH1004_003353 [Aspergillus tanneri]
MISPKPFTLYSLPNEVFVQILSSFPTRTLLPLTTISHRFHSLILRILHYRLLFSASLEEYKLILECFHPSSKLIEPHIFCKHLGTDGLSTRHEGTGSMYEDFNPAQRLGRLTALYSRFRPEATVREIMSGTRLVPSNPELSPDQERVTVTRPVHLESFEDFSQLCVVVNIFKGMPGGQSHLLMSANTVQDGVVRVFRDWLKEHSCSRCVDTSHDDDEDTEGESHLNTNDQCHMLWVDQDRNVGLKVRVRKTNYLDESITDLVLPDEEVLTSYELDIEELHVRTTRLLLTMERSLVEQQHQQNYTKTVMFTRRLDRPMISMIYDTQNPVDDIR